MTKMLDVYRANPKLGNVALPAKQLEENGQMIDNLHQELSKYEVDFLLPICLFFFYFGRLVFAFNSYFFNI